ncbi:hypothetical protein FBZ84_11149 [Azospirillum baldaniorum]|uniref:hypothetical protein n=1 Tax=Azospirillum baldaniorum TaxID=1064539 RepID=UPI0011A2E93A|nr:hypothetical protein [Azospirillum baldaniorum]TWA62274.1 hypothetical protein FBZ84_11149 [Azospirillum baldaniorum]
MLHLSRPQALATLPASCPSDRRERHPLQPVSAHPCTPAFERSDAAIHPAVPAAVPAAAQPMSPLRPGFNGEPLARVIRLATTGVWVVKRHGQMLEIDGRLHWSCPRTLASDAERAGVILSDLVVNTGHQL